MSIFFRLFRLFVGSSIVCEHSFPILFRNGNVFEVRRVIDVLIDNQIFFFFCGFRVCYCFRCDTSRCRSIFFLLRYFLNPDAETAPEAVCTWGARLASAVHLRKIVAYLRGGSRSGGFARIIISHEPHKGKTIGFCEGITTKLFPIRFCPCGFHVNNKHCHPHPHHRFFFRFAHQLDLRKT